MKNAIATLALLSALLQAQSHNCPRVNEGVAPEHCHWLEVTSVLPGSNAEKAGLRVGDIICSYAGRTVGCLKDLQAARDAAETEVVTIVVKREDKMLEVQMPKGQLGVSLKEWEKDIVPDPDAKLIKGVAELGWHTGKENSFMAAAEAALNAIGVKADYTDLCGVSGAAFRLQFFDSWCPSSPDPTCGFDASEPALASYGYKADFLCLASDGKNRPELLKRIKASLDAGVPVIGIDMVGMPEWGVITGYQKDCEELFVRTYFDRRKNLELAEKFPWIVAFLVKTGEPQDVAENYRNLCRVVNENLTTEKYDQYYSGLAGFDHWIMRLRSDSFKELDSSQFSNVMLANYWIYARLVSDRRLGVEYLRKMAAALPDRHVVLNNLAEIYDQEVATLAPFLEKMPRPGTVTKPAEWAAELKNEQISVLTKARTFEAQAAALWRQLAE